MNHTRVKRILYRKSHITDSTFSQIYHIQTNAKRPDQSKKKLGLSAETIIANEMANTEM